MGVGACPKKRRRHSSIPTASEHSEAVGKEELKE
ncbi:hypothetical protein M2142_002236 [Fusobacterium sp. PH5-29]